MKQRFYVYRVYALVLSLCVTVLVAFACGIIRRPIELKWLFWLAVLIIAIMGSIRVSMRAWFNDGRCGMDCPEYEEILSYASLYKRKMMSSVILLFALMAFGALGNGWIAMCGVFIVCNNGIKQSLFSNMIPDEMKSSFSRYVKQLCCYSLVYWGVAALLLLVLFLCDISTTRMNQILMVAGVIYLAAFMAYFLLKRERYLAVVEKIPLVKKCVVAAVCFGLFMYLGMVKGCLRLQLDIIRTTEVPHEETKITYEKNSGTYSIIMNHDEFKILHLTDIHIAGSVFTYQCDRKALDTVYDLINYTRPDLVIITGDIVYPMGLFSFSINNETPFMQFTSFMKRIGIPWAFVYGNHDTEAMATKSADDLKGLFREYSYYKNGGNLLFPDVQPGITGRNNQVIKILNQDKTLNQALFLIDSNAYVNDDLGDYDYVHDDQVAWYEDQVRKMSQSNGELISSMIFLHIPLQEYETAYKLYQKGNSQVAYYFGELAEGGVSASKHGSTLFETAVRLNSTKAIIAGHDHYNNICLGYKGIKLTYGLSIDYIAMPGIGKKTKQRGGTLITLHNDQTFDMEQILYSRIAVLE